MNDAAQIAEELAGRRPIELLHAALQDDALLAAEHAGLLQYFAEAGLPEPRIGVFWYDLDREWVYADDQPLSKCRGVSVPAEEYVLYHPIHDHFEIWETIAETNTQWGGMEYEDVPRGRVTLIRGPGKQLRFVVRLAPQLDTPERRNRIMTTFQLPPDMVEFDFSDIHYCTDPDVLDDFFRDTGD